MARKLTKSEIGIFEQEYPIARRTKETIAPNDQREITFTMSKEQWARVAGAETSPFFAIIPLPPTAEKEKLYPVLEESKAEVEKRREQRRKERRETLGQIRDLNASPEPVDESRLP